MLSVGLSEMLLVLVVGCLVTDPKKIPDLLRGAAIYYKKCKEIKEEVLQSLNEICEENSKKDVDYVNRKHKVVGNDGSLYEAYEINDLVVKDELSEEKARNANTECNPSDQSAKNN